MLYLTIAILFLVALANLFGIPDKVRGVTDSLAALYFVTVALVALFITRAKRGARLAWANINQTYAGTDTSRRSPAVCYSGVVAGNPYLVGQLPCVAMDTAANVSNGTPTFLFGGTFALTVTGANSGGNAAINPGDKLYIASGTRDTASNMYYGGTINANSGGTFFGYLDPTGPGVASGATVTASVLLGGPGM